MTGTQEALCRKLQNRTTAALKELNPIRLYIYAISELNSKMLHV